MKPTKYLILDYLRQHIGEDNTVKLLSEKLKLSYRQVTNNVQHLEYMKMVTRSPKYLPDSAGHERKQFIYNISEDETPGVSPGARYVRSDWMK